MVQIFPEKTSRGPFYLTFTKRETTIFVRRLSFLILFDFVPFQFIITIYIRGDGTHQNKQRMYINWNLIF